MEKRKSFKESFSEEIRLKQSGELIDNYSDVIPVIVEQSKHSKLKEFDRKKYCIAKTMKACHLICMIRKRMKLSRFHSVNLFLNNNEMLKSDTKFDEIYEKYRDKDGFLYLEYCEYLTFGG